MGGAGVQARELARRAIHITRHRGKLCALADEQLAAGAADAFGGVGARGLLRPKKQLAAPWKIDYSCGAAGVLGGPDAAVVEVLPDGIDGGEEILLQLGCEEVVYVQRSARGVAQPQDIAAGSWTPATGVYAGRIATRDFRMRIGDPSAPKDQKLIEDWSEKVLLKLQNLKPGNWLPAEGL
uniref:Uncharacterized protein n=1 Tax=Oryza nivara TaxID=4536 RepID=A0A0E0GMS5_ORYNI